MSEIVTEVLQPLERLGWRIFKANIDGIEWIVKVKLIGSANAYLHRHYRVLLFTPDGIMIKTTHHPKWNQLRKEILREIMRHKQNTGMAASVARL